MDTLPVLSSLRNSHYGHFICTLFSSLLQPLGGANFKPWGKSDFGFPCCWGTLSESFAKLGDSIFFWQPAGVASPSAAPALFVNQFVTSTVQLRGLSGRDGWDGRDGLGGAAGISVEQTSGFPGDQSSTTTLTVHVDAHGSSRAGAGAGSVSSSPSSSSSSFAIMLRIPAWATSTTQNTVTVNGAAVADAITPGSYLRVERAWKDGDVIEAHFPMTLWTDPLNDYHAVRLSGGERG